MQPGSLPSANGGTDQGIAAATPQHVRITQYEEKTTSETNNVMKQPHPDRHKLFINNRHLNRKEKKEWLFGLNRPRFPSNYIRTTKVCSLYGVIRNLFRV